MRYINNKSGTFAISNILFLTSKKMIHRFMHSMVSDQTRECCISNIYNLPAFERFQGNSYKCVVIFHIAIDIMQIFYSMNGEGRC